VISIPIDVDLFAPACLNRPQLRDNQQMVDLTDAARALQFAGVLQSPIARFRSFHPPKPVIRRGRVPRAFSRLSDTGVIPR
jgi:hypothetical protein